MSIRLRQLRAFKAIVEHGSVSEAAATLGLTQSTVSKVLAALELEIGFKLFDRAGRRLGLSEQGQLFYQQTVNAIDLLEGIQSAAADIRENVSARFRVAAIGPLLMSSFLPRVLAGFAKEFPQYRFTVETKTRAEIGDWVANQHTDIGFTLLPVQQRQLQSRTVARVRAVAIVPAGHDLSDRPFLKPRDTRNTCLVMPRSSVRLRHLVEASFIQAGIDLRPSFETSNAVSTANLVAEGLGIAIVDPFTVTGIPPWKIKALPWEPTTILDYGMIWPGSRSLKSHERRLLEIASDIAEELALSHAHLELC